MASKYGTRLRIARADTTFSKKPQKSQKFGEYFETVFVSVNAKFGNFSSVVDGQRCCVTDADEILRLATSERIV